MALLPILKTLIINDRGSAGQLYRLDVYRPGLALGGALSGLHNSQCLSVQGFHVDLTVIAPAQDRALPDSRHTGHGDVLQ